jgi:hypothetical protein
MNKYKLLIQKLKELIAHVRVTPGKSTTLLDVELKSKWIQKEIKLESEIALLESELAKEKPSFDENSKSDDEFVKAYEEPEGVTADVETVLFDVMTENNFTYVSFPDFVENESSVDVFDIACKAMERIASSKQINLREELKNFNSWMCGKQYDGRIPLIGTCIDEYLQSKEK